MEGQLEMAWILIDSLKKIMKVFSVKSQKNYERNKDITLFCENDEDF